MVCVQRKNAVETTLEIHSATLYIHSATLYIHSTTLYIHSTTLYIHSTTLTNVIEQPISCKICVLKNDFAGGEIHP
jgi:hypothetical protein